MNHIRRIRRSLSSLPRRAGLLIASAAPALLWADPPLPPGWQNTLHLPARPHDAVRSSPGRTTHLPPPPHGHAVVTGGLPSWRIILVVAVAAALAAAVVILTRPRQQPAASALAPAEPPPTDIARGATRLRSGRVHDQHGHEGSRSEEPSRPQPERRRPR